MTRVCRIRTPLGRAERRGKDGDDGGAGDKFFFVGFFFLGGGGFSVWKWGFDWIFNFFWGFVEEKFTRAEIKHEGKSYRRDLLLWAGGCVG